jgi:hypothetical protein
MAGKKTLWNAVPACVLLRKSFRNGVLARSVTKIPLILIHGRSKTQPDTKRTNELNYQIGHMFETTGEKWW